MKNLALSLLLFGGMCNSSMAQTAFLCVADTATGFKYDQNAKAWRNVTFSVKDTKRVLKKTNEGWVWSQFGEQYGDQCGDFNKHGFLNCPVIGGTMRFNKNTLRYMESYEIGYVDGRDDNKNTPGLTIGKCSPL